jgi:hypothetical protein
MKSSRNAPRWIAYPALLIFPLAAIVGGIWLGHLGIGTNLMIGSIYSTPAENWVMTLLAICIAMITFLMWGYENRTYRFGWRSFASVASYPIIMFLFGAWGLLALVALCVIWFVAALLRSRTSKNQHSQDEPIS